jgi:hypothetical protein
MTETPRQNPMEPLPSMRADVRAEAVLALHLIALRRQFDVIRQVFGDDPPHRAREALWAMLEVTSADLHGRQIALRDLVVRAEGLLSGPTLSRVVADLERSGLLVSDPAPEDSRVKRLRPTARTLEILMTRADAAFTEFAGVVKEAKQALA